MNRERAGSVHTDTRDVLRSFAPGVSDPQLLRWNPQLDEEDGRGVRVALLDSGIVLRHRAFTSADIQARDFTRSGSLADPSYHGTRGAGLLIAQAAGWPRGLAPGCTLLVGKVLEHKGCVVDGPQRLARAIDWALAEGAAIIILPFGRARSSCLVTRALERALAAGCTCFAAAGNQGPQNFLFPARMPGVQAVSGARPDGTPLSLCCQVAAVGCYAPGSGISTLGRQGAETMTGSSPATVLAAGMAVLHLAHQKRKEGAGD